MSLVALANTREDDSKSEATCKNMSKFCAITLTKKKQIRRNLSTDDTDDTDYARALLVLPSRW